MVGSAPGLCQSLLLLLTFSPWLGQFSHCPAALQRVTEGLFWPEDPPVLGQKWPVLAQAGLATQADLMTPVAGLPRSAQHSDSGLGPPSQLFCCWLSVSE